MQRSELRQMLLDSLPAATVQWGRKLNGARRLGDGHHEVLFADGATVTTILLVEDVSSSVELRRRPGDHQAAATLSL